MTLNPTTQPKHVNAKSSIVYLAPATDLKYSQEPYTPNLGDKTSISRLEHNRDTSQGSDAHGPSNRRTTPFLRD